MINPALNKKLVLQAIKTLREITEKHIESSDKKSLFEDETKSEIYLQCTLKKIPKNKSIKMIKVHLPHSLVKDTSEICLIAGDLDKRNRKAEIEPDVLHYKELLQKKGISQISEVMTLRQLRTEYKPYEAKQKLLAAFDIFLADNKITECLPRILGKHFFRKRKFPIQINLRTTNLKEQIENALTSKVFYFTGHGNCCTTEVAYLDMKDSEILENIMSVAETLLEKLPGSLDNIMGMYLKTSKSASIPLYISYGNPNDVSVDDEKEENIFCVDELTTAPDLKVKVFNDGRVHTIRIKGDADDANMQQNSESCFKNLDVEVKEEDDEEEESATIKPEPVSENNKIISKPDIKMENTPEKIKGRKRKSLIAQNLNNGNSVDDEKEENIFCVDELTTVPDLKVKVFNDGRVHTIRIEGDADDANMQQNSESCFKNLDIEVKEEDDEEGESAKIKPEPAYENNKIISKPDIKMENTPEKIKGRKRKSHIGQNLNNEKKSVTSDTEDEEDEKIKKELAEIKSKFISEFPDISDIVELKTERKTKEGKRKRHLSVQDSNDKSDLDSEVLVKNKKSKKQKAENKPELPASNLQSDWKPRKQKKNLKDSDLDSEVLAKNKKSKKQKAENKPELPASDLQSDWKPRKQKKNMKDLDSEVLVKNKKSKKQKAENKPELSAFDLQSDCKPRKQKKNLKDSDLGSKVLVKNKKSMKQKAENKPELPASDLQSDCKPRKQKKNLKGNKRIYPAS